MLLPQSAVKRFIKTRRRIIVNPLLALLKHDIPLRGKIFLADFQPLHPVRFQKHCQFQPADIQKLMIRRHVLRRKSIAFGTVFFQHAVKPLPSDLRRSAKHQMFQQMSNAALTRRFINRSGFIKQHLFDNRRLMVFNNNNLQTVIQKELFCLKSFGLCLKRQTQAQNGK